MESVLSRTLIKYLGPLALSAPYSSDGCVKGQHLDGLVSPGLEGQVPEARRGSQGASRAAPAKSGLHARGEGERVLALESREGTRASRRVEEGLSRSLSGGGLSHV